MGSLAPHDAAASSPDQQQWIADPRTGCRALDTDFAAGDSITWSGPCGVGLAWGHGALSFVSNGRVLETVTGNFASGTLQPGHVTAFWADGSKYDGDQLGGEFDGKGIFTSATGDRLEGQWKAGALNGHATVTWANGDRYDGEWKNGKSDGQGTEVWANGHRYEGLWADGKPAGDPVPNPSASAQLVPPVPSQPVQAAPPAPEPEKPVSYTSTVAESESAANASPLGSLIGTKLLSVEGATVELNLSEDGLSRVVTLPSGATQQISFTFMSPRIGTVSSDSAAIGLFRTNQSEFDINFADGTVEAMKQQSGGGLLVTSHTADGQTLCTAWYPQGHAFAEAEKKAAVQEYAARLGVAISTSSRKIRGVHADSLNCGGAFLEKLPQPGDSAAAGTTDSRPDYKPVVLSSFGKQSEDVARAPVSSNDTHDMQNVSVKASTVHLIDTANTSNTAQPLVQAASFAVKATAPAVSKAPEPATDSHDDLNASQCLSVVSNGQYWGFQNSCEKAVQFAYCEMSEANPLTSCHHTSVVGSVGANGFSSLVTDQSLSEQGVNHEFRWMACDGGAGEVVPHLDSIDPPAGRCLRAVASAEQ